MAHESTKATQQADRNRNSVRPFVCDLRVLVDVCHLTTPTPQSSSTRDCDMRPPAMPAQCRYCCSIFITNRLTIENTTNKFTQHEMILYPQQHPIKII